MKLAIVLLYAAQVSAVRPAAKATASSPIPVTYGDIRHNKTPADLQSELTAVMTKESGRLLAEHTENYIIDWYSMSVSMLKFARSQIQNIGYLEDDFESTFKTCRDPLYQTKQEAACRAIIDNVYPDLQALAKQHPQLRFKFVEQMENASTVCGPHKLPYRDNVMNAHLLLRLELKTALDYANPNSNWVATMRKRLSCTRCVMRYTRFPRLEMECGWCRNGLSDQDIANKIEPALDTWRRYSKQRIPVMEWKDHHFSWLKFEYGTRHKISRDRAVLKRLSPHY